MSSNPTPARIVAWMSKEQHDAYDRTMHASEGCEFEAEIEARSAYSLCDNTWSPFADEWTRPLYSLKADGSGFELSPDSHTLDPEDGVDWFFAGVPVMVATLLFPMGYTVKQVTAIQPDVEALWDIDSANPYGSSTHKAMSYIWHLALAEQGMGAEDRRLLQKAVNGRWSKPGTCDLLGWEPGTEVTEDLRESWRFLVGLLNT